MLRAAFRLLGDRALIVSDSMRANGMPEGEAFDLGGQMVTVHQGKALLPDGTIAGSVTNLHQEIKNLVSFGVPFEQAVKAATLIPARAIGLDGEIGSIAPASAPTWWCWMKTWTSPLCTTKHKKRGRAAAIRGSPSFLLFCLCYWLTWQPSRRPTKAQGAGVPGTG